MAIVAQPAGQREKLAAQLGRDGDQVVVHRLPGSRKQAPVHEQLAQHDVAHAESHRREICSAEAAQQIVVASTATDGA